MIKPGYVAPPAVAPVSSRQLPDYYTVPADREITIRDLLTHTSGLESGDLGNRVGARIAPRDTDSAGRLRPEARQPCRSTSSPARSGRYSLLAGMDTLGANRRDRVGTDLRHVPEAAALRSARDEGHASSSAATRPAASVDAYDRTPKGLERQDTPAWLATKTFFSGGGGLWSTAEDYAQFAQMLVNGGELNGKRLLSPRTVDLMSTNHVGDLYTGAGAGSRLQGMGFGLSMEVVLDAVRANRRTSTGSFGWDGAFGTHFWVDPKEKLIGVLMVQTPAPE